MCDSLNRTGVLCSLCKAGLGPALLNYSHPCLECTSYGWVAYFAATLIPATLFFIFIVTFHVDATSPTLSFLILYSHIWLSALQHNPNFLHSVKHYNRLYISVPVLLTTLTFYGFWNLDFFRQLIPSFCASRNMSMLTVLALEYVVALYPLLFTAIVYITIELHARGCKLLNIMWRPFNPIFYQFRKFCNIRGSVINAFATFICFSYSKILLTSFSILSFTLISSSNPSNFTNKTFLYFNSSISFDKPGNIPYYVVGIVMPTVFCILPLITLLVFHTRLCKCFHKYKLLCEVVKVFQKHFKDGTDGTSDYRFFSGFYFTIRVFYFLIRYLNTLYYYYADWFLCFCALLLISYLQPYKERKYNGLDTFWFAGLTAIIFSLQYQATVAGGKKINDIVVAVGLLVPFFYINILVIYIVLKTIRKKICWTHCQGTRCTCCYRKSTGSMQDELPDRIINSVEYRPLLQK